MTGGERVTPAALSGTVMFAFTGAAAIGVVCGWWSAPLTAARAPFSSWSAVAGAMAVLGFEAAWLGDLIAVLALVIGFAAGLAAHSAFRAALTARLTPPRRYR